MFLITSIKDALNYIKTLTTIVIRSQQSHNKINKNNNKQNKDMMQKKLHS